MTDMTGTQSVVLLVVVAVIFLAGWVAGWTQGIASQVQVHADAARRAQALGDVQARLAEAYPRPAETRYSTHCRCGSILWSRAEVASGVCLACGWKEGL